MSESDENREECFIPANWEEASPELIKEMEIPYLNINKLLSEAKELHQRAKPSELYARTCFLEIDIVKLPTWVQEPCQEEEEEVNQELETMPSILNNNFLSFEEHFKDFEVVYNKMKSYIRPNFYCSDLTSRFKQISHLNDFSEKLFKELPENNHKDSPTHVYENDEFYSNFENGNLGLVYKGQETQNREYYLLLENDVNSHGYTSWFFFKVRSCGKGKASFHILNLSKSPYLYKLGWKVSIFSQRKYEETGKKWFKGGINIQTYTTNFEKKTGGTFSCFYFEYDFEENENEVYFAMNKPYSYTMMANDIENLEKTSLNKKNIQIETIKSIFSISCNIVPVLIVTEKNITETIIIEEIKFPINKKCIVFMARQHPGEVVGSNMMSQLMKIISEELPELKALLKLYTIILIPMVNPDGVIHGNSRCNLAGLDLNRQWMKDCNRDVTPETYFLRKFLWELQEKLGIEYLIDLHGHSKKMNSFFFCNKTSDKFTTEYLPFLVSKIDKRFEFNSCTFNMTIDKKNTLRNQLFETGMKNCVTVESSYFGYFNEKSAIPYTDNDYLEMMKSIIKTLTFMLTEEQFEFNHTNSFTRYSKEEIIKEIKNNKEISIKKTKNTINHELESDSDPEGDILKPEEMIKIYQGKEILTKKKSETKYRKKIKNKEIKETKIKKEKVFIKNEEDDEIRKSEPMKYHIEKSPVNNKNHKSEKKLETVVENRRALTQQKFREKPVKPQLFARKYSEKKDRMIKTTVLNINDEKETSPQPPEPIEEKEKGFTGSNIYKNLNYEAIINPKPKKLQTQTRLKTDSLHDKNLTKYQIHNQTTYSKIREERLQMFLNETLSIIKVNNHEMLLKSNNDIDTRKQSLKTKFSEIKLTSERLKTETPIHYEFTNQYENINDLQESRKKFISKNYRKEILKRKKILSVQEETKNYKRFENFLEAEEKQENKNHSKMEGNSVFYYFPIL